MMTDEHALQLRPASVADLDAVNALIESAVMTWQLPERVKRLSLPSYRYHAHDLEHLQLVVAENVELGIVGVAAWEPAKAGEAPAGCTALLLHGIYVAPNQHRKGIGRRLWTAAENAARASGFDGVLVKAQPAAVEFFRALGLERLAVEHPGRDYPHRFWKPVV
jgi:predicted N-acetyltransferase YhbS